METLDTDGLRAALRGAQRGPGVVTNYFFESLEASSFPVLRSEHSLVVLDLRATGWQVFYATREPAVRDGDTFRMPGRRPFRRP